MSYRYAYDGPGETFPEPPIARFLEPGEEVETGDPVEHPHLRLVSGPPLSAFWLEREEAPAPTPPPVVPAPADSPPIAPEPVAAPAPEPTT